MTTATMPTLPMRIDVNLSEWPQDCKSPNEEKIQAMKDRLSTTPTKAPEERAQELAARTARTALLHKLELEAKQSRAKRANDLVKENKARKLRMEAAAVARASSKIEKATKVESTRRQEHEAKREAATARRTALFDAVRAARENRQTAREARQAELASLEQKATSLREKKLQSTVSRSSAQVKHALHVAVSLKEKEKEATAAAAIRLADRLSAATDRRQDKLAATAEGAASVGVAAEKVRLRHLYEEKAAIEERRHRLTKAMDNANGRREAKLESITSRAAAENARVADVVAESKENDTLKPASMRHALTKRLQAAEVRRLEALKKSPLPSLSRGASREVSPKSSPSASPRKEAMPPSPWSTPLIRSHKPEPVIVINTEPFHFAAQAPSSRLLSRLHFRPRMLLATAAARQASAAGRRQTRLNLARARASHFGTVRVAVVRGRRAALAEFCRSLDELRVKKAGDRAAAHLRGKVSTAARFNERVNAAKVNRSNLRLRTLNAAIVKEEKRLAAASRRIAKLEVLREGRYEEAKTFAVKVRRAAAMERLVSRGIDLQKRCLEADNRRDMALSAVVFRARRAMKGNANKSEGAPAKLTDAKLSDEKMSGVEAKEAKEDVPKAEAEAPKAEVEAAPKAEATECSNLDYMDARITELKHLLEKRLQEALAACHKGAGEELAKDRADAVRKAADVSAAGAARAEALVKAKQEARASAKAVKASLEDAAAMAGLQGAAKKATAASGKLPSAPSSVASSVASSDTEEWHVVAAKK